MRRQQREARPRSATSYTPTWRSRAALLALLLALVAGGGVALWRYMLASRSDVAFLVPGTAGTLRTKNAAGRSGAYYLPSGYKGRALPLLVAIHGTGGNGAGSVQLFREAAERDKFFIVAPESRRAPDGRDSWEVGDHPGEITPDFQHIQACVDELLAMPEVRIDTTRVLIAGQSGGGSTAPYVATSVEPYTAFAVLHGGVFVGGLGNRRVRGWFSTGASDGMRPPSGVQSAAGANAAASIRKSNG
jgi:polyhydroxybutyrate depolymerase